MTDIFSKRTKVMLVEDDPLLVRMYEKAFGLLGYDIELAFNGEDGFKKIKEAKEKPTVILSDVMMPKMNGLEMLKKIKGDDELKNIPLVLLTNLAEEKDAIAGLTLGAIAYLVKSQYSPKEIVEKLKEVVTAYERGKSVPEVRTKIKKLDS
jgi:DNA-binding response OmpR family regulator